MKPENINKLYNDPSKPGSLSGLSGFLKNNKKITKKQALSVLSYNKAFTLHKPARRKFYTAPFISSGIDHTWHLDLADVQNLRNKSLKQYYSYLLVCVDVLSKYAWVEPMANKEADTCKSAFERILKNSMPRKPRAVYMDKGREFMGSFLKFCEKNDIKQFFTNSKNKASIAERFNRTLKNRLYRYFSLTGEKNYIKILQDVVKSYNDSYHRSIKMSPSEVSSKNERNVFDVLYTKNNEASKLNFKVGDYVRIQINKKLFEKGYTQNWSSDMFILSSIDHSVIPLRLTIKTIEGKQIDKFFYREQLQKVNFSEFPYDSFEILKETSNLFLVKQLNAENSKETWISKDETEQTKSEDISNLQLNDQNNNKQSASKSKDKRPGLQKREGLRTRRL